MTLFHANSYGFARPFIKWVGGKSALIQDIRGLLPVRFNEYWEPFLGGGSIFYAMRHLITSAHLSDAVGELIDTYKMIAVHPQTVHQFMGQLFRKNNYYWVRDYFSPSTDEWKAARFLYLNWAGYNGLYRVNRSGKFNVPKGTPPPLQKEQYPSLERFLQCSDALQNVGLRAGDWQEINPGPGDLIYLDPPYYGTYNQYTPRRFSEQDQKTLAYQADLWRQRGAYPVISNSHDPFIDNLYPDSNWTKHLLDTRNSVGGDIKERGTRTEYLITPNTPLDPLSIPVKGINL